MDEKRNLLKTVEEVLPVTFAFNSITYSVSAKGESKKLLNNVSGIVKPGTVLAIMGPSGAGKTTLLDVLANRVSKGDLSGNLTINGETFASRQAQKAFRRITGYVMQDDSLIGSLTVFESLDYVARLKLPHLKKQERKEKIEKILGQLGILHIKDSLIGTQFRRGISGGEKRRVAIGVELLTAPSILFLDEPTSGLDGASAYTVMKTIIALAKTGCCIICTIHQPRSNIYSLFDQLLLLSRGEVAYMGPAQSAMNYFENLGYQMNYASNPADWMLDLVTGTTIGEVAPEDAPLKIDFGAAFKKSNTCADIEKAIKSYTPDPSANKVHQVMNSLSAYASSYLSQAYVLFLRNSVSNLRNPAIIWIRLIQSCFMAVLIGSIFWQVSDTTSGIKGRTSALFFSCTFMVMSSFAALPILIEERGRFNRELQSNMYGTWAYFSASFSSMFPFLIIFAATFGTICYWMVGLNPSAENFFFYLVATTTLALVGDAMVKSVGALVKSFSIAAAMASIVMTFFMFFSGFFISIEELPKVWKWAPYISPFKYGLQAIMINEFQDIKLLCDESIKICQKTEVYVDGASVLQFFGIADVYNPWWDVFVLFLMWCALRLAQFLFLKFLNKEKR